MRGARDGSADCSADSLILTTPYVGVIVSRAGPTVYVVIWSDRQPKRFAQALVECEGGNEATQDADLACLFPRRVLQLRLGVRRSPQDCLGHDFRRIVFFVASPTATVMPARAYS